MNQQQDDTQMAALVAADRADVGSPDLAALRAGGRRRLLRTRVAVGAGAVAVVAAIAVPVAVFGGGDGRTAQETPIASDPASATTPPTSTPSAPPSTEPGGGFQRPENGEIPLPGGGTLNGPYDEGTLIGEPLVMGQIGEHDEVLYAASGPALVPDDDRAGEIYVGEGVRDGSRIVRNGVVIYPEFAEHPDGIQLYDGARIDYYDFRDPYYEIVGTIRGEVEVSVSGPDGTSRPVTDSSTTMVPGYTVFFDKGPWDASWDVLELAPLTISTDDGRSVEVRSRSYSN